MIKLVRCDDRLIHGQCIVRVITDFRIERILIVDNFTASNPVLKNIFTMAVPPQVKAVVLTVDEAKGVIDKYMENNENVLLLMKSPEIALELFKSIPQLKKEFNIGPMSNRKNTTKVTPYAYLLKEEADAIKSLAEMGVKVYFNQVIDQKRVEWEEVKNLFD